MARRVRATQPSPPGLIVREDWGSVLALLQADKDVQRQRGGRRGRRDRREQGNIEEDETKAQAKLKKTVLALLKRGQVSRAVRRICSNGLASLDDPQVQAALQAKYPARGRDLPTHVTKGQCMDKLDGLKEKLMALDPGVAPGFGGMRNEHLRCLAEVWEEDEMECLETFSLRYLNGDLPPWFFKVWALFQPSPYLRTF